jgi:DNA-binding CsgD family transcriptional regulator
MVFELSIMIEGILAIIGIRILNEHRLLSIELLSIFYSFVAIRFLNKRQIVAEKFEEISIVNFDKELLLVFSEAYGLTHRENEIMGYLIQGISNNEICKAAYISEGTVKTHSHNIYSKLHVKNRTQLGIKFREFQKNK